ncbi:MAG: NERD domain-containing protein [Candidatus Bathyarchaeota archaeon]|nr:NERD domain-containing protein [Candidatus Bathyarchaeota archaeon]
MSVERNLVISLLKTTKNGLVLIENVKQHARLPTAVAVELLEKLQNEGLLYLRSDSVVIESQGRLQLAVKAASLGADVQLISDLLCWQEFEEIGALALKNNGYVVYKNVRFKHGGRRWEIDVIGCKKPLVICVDCKHWQRAMAASVAARIAQEQAQRTYAFSESLPNISLNFECTRWEKAKFIPAVLSLLPSSQKFHGKVPIVPVLQMQDFISQMPAYLENLQVYHKNFKTLSHDFEDCRL